MIDRELFKKVYQQSNEMTVDDCKDLLNEASSPEEECFFMWAYVILSCKTVKRS